MQMAQATAIEYSHIQFNRPKLVSWLAFDLDYPKAAFAWEGAGLPPPTIVVVNPVNAHAHIFYGLVAPVSRSTASRLQPINYLKAIEVAFKLKLKADPGYTGFIAKNPFHPRWKTIWGARLYELGELAEYVDLPKQLPKRSAGDMAGYGRNTTLFEQTRQWCYRNVLARKSAGFSRDRWFDEVLLKASEENKFTPPLPFSEVKSIARSLAKWTWQRFTVAEFSKIQSARGKLGGRPRTTTKDGEPWTEQGLSRSQYYKRRKKHEGLQDTSDVGM